MNIKYKDFSFICKNKKDGLQTMKSLFDKPINENEVSYTLDDDDINHEFKKRFKSLVSEYTQEEQGTWQTQLEEAKAYLANNTTPTPMLTEIADGLNIQTLAQKIWAKAEFLKVESGKLLAWKNRELAKIK